MRGISEQRHLMTISKKGYSRGSGSVTVLYALKEHCRQGCRTREEVSDKGGSLKGPLTRILN